MQIIITPAQKSWPRDFQHLKAELLTLSPPGAYVHHIGSTAVPDLAAKDIIDIQITVDDLTKVDPAGFLAAGHRQSEHTSDHCPPGMDLAPADLAKHLFVVFTPRRAHVHIRQRGAFNQKFPLICRDYLRSHPVTAKAYEQIKQRLAAFFPEDQDAYYDIKDPVFDIIHEGAMEWAKRTNWSEAAPD
ncbi:GrpB family protein [Devosia sp.]|uniref:GrpB family protein n=1 Tax=Devosia sp. TaxID=1871048 RepID=UPI001B066C3B|nr:GrpB family protein [Devosia sp.]MBO9588078.1 GrpB family protein [Devosia sp.]